MEGGIGEGEKEVSLSPHTKEKKQSEEMLKEEASQREDERR